MLFRYIKAAQADAYRRAGWTVQTLDNHHGAAGYMLAWRR